MNLAYNLLAGVPSKWYNLSVPSVVLCKLGAPGGIRTRTVDSSMLFPSTFWGTGANAVWESRFRADQTQTPRLPFCWATTAGPYYLTFPAFTLPHLLMFP